MLHVPAHVACVVIPAVALAQAPPQFPSPTFPWSGTINSSAVLIADVTGDGKTDLVAVNGATQLHRFTGDGVGNFAGPVITSSGTGSLGPSALAIADLNGDFTPDVAITNSSNSTMSTMLNSGIGTFTLGTPVATGSKPMAIRLADFNLDGKTDAITVNELGNNASLLLGNGAGGFAAAVNVSVGTQPLGLDVADFNSDGRPDIATANFSSDNLSVRLGDGLGGFGAIANFSVFDRPSSLSVGDVNSDGTPDLVAGAATFAPGFVYTRFGDGLGGFGAVSNTAIADQVTGIVLADFSADGKLDFAATNKTPSLVTIGVNNGGGSFPTTFTLPCNTSPGFLTVGDVDGNGRPDLAVVSIVNDIQVFRSDGASGLLAGKTFATASTPMEVALADLDQNGVLDALVAASTSNSVSRLFGTGAGGFLAGSPLTTGAQTRAIVTADFNGDHKIDFVTANQGGNDASVCLGSGGGAFGPPVLLPMGSSPQAVIAADFNSDGKTDFATANTSSNNITMRIGDGIGGFGASTAFAVLGGPRDAVGADVDKDGDVDLACVVSGNAFRVLRCDGAGGFLAPVSTIINGSSSGSNAVAAGDFDGDGFHDLALDYAVAGVPSIATYRSLGGGTFVGTFAATLNLGAAGVTLADLNKDGRDDLLVSTSRVIYYTGDGAGSFTRLGSFGTGGNPGPTAVGDLDLDGLPDLVTPNTTAGSTVSVLRNLLAEPIGTSDYGTGTRGCSGILGLAASGVATLGSPTFGLSSTNSPRWSLGLCIVADAPDFGGSDPFFLNLILHVDLFASVGILALDSMSDSWGSGFAPLPLSSDPAFLGASFYAQMIYVEPGSFLCTSGTLGLVSSKGLQFTIQ